ncbi:MAG TPA: HAMP domain-containing histidine kinase [Ignavibacteria bacterium]|nr:HAMP domain-containing histidine kinase [Ignavibacteria bacterium]
MKILSPRNKFLLTLIIAALTVSFITIYFTNRFVRELKQEERQKIDLWANAVKYISIESGTCEDFSLIFEIVQNNRTVPVILTDEDGKVIGFRNIELPESQDSVYFSNLLNKMKAEHEPITIELPDGSKNYVYYFNSLTLKKLNYYPYIQLIIITFFIGIAFYSYGQARKSEQNLIWLGMAKETAHQLGTPTSSLMACSSLLSEKYPNDVVIVELEKDVKRIETIASRFSKIGSSPNLDSIDVTNLISDTINYQSKRCPRTITFNFSPGNPIYAKANYILLGWVLENLLKNSVDAMHGKGVITVVTTTEKNNVIIDIKDQGKGIEKRKQKEIFRAGYTTKERGWGLGLSLAKRIIEQYHSGKIFVLHSELGVGSTFRIILKKA